MIRLAVAVATLLAIAACALQRTDQVPTTEDTRPAVDVRYGTIVAIRPASHPADNAGVATILLAIGAAGSGAPARGRAVEVIVREDFAAAPMSVVQSDAQHLRPGDRVVITRGTRTRLARGAPPPSDGS